MAVPCEFSKHLHFFLVELLLYHRTCDVFLVTIVKMFVDVILLQLIDHLTLLLTILWPLVSLGPIWHKLDIIDQIYRVLDILGNG